MKNQNQIPNQKQDGKEIDNKNFNTKDTEVAQDKGQDQKGNLKASSEKTDHNVKSMESARAGKHEAPEAASSKPLNAGSEEKSDQQWQGKARTADVDAEGKDDAEGIEGKGHLRHAESPDAHSAKSAKTA
jgi:hypothetical protein